MVTKSPLAKMLARFVGENGKPRVFGFGEVCRVVGFGYILIDVSLRQQ